MTRRAVAAAAATFLVGLASGPSASRADLVAPPPTRCPPGAIERTGHMGPYCAPTECLRVEDCADYATRSPREDARFECAPAGLCVRPQQVVGARGRVITIDVVHASCQTDADCPGGIPCAMADRCRQLGDPEDIEPSPPIPRAAGEPRSAAGCGGGGPTTFALLALLVAGVGFGVRRHQRDAAYERARALLGRGAPVRHHELLAIVDDDAHLSRALAPIASRLRVEEDAEGELVFHLDRGGRERPSEIDPRRRRRPPPS